MVTANNEVRVNNALVIGSKDWRCHRNLKVNFVKLTEIDYSTIRRQFNVPNTLRHNDALMDDVGNDGWGNYNSQIKNEVEVACKKVKSSCTRNNVEYLIYTLPLSKTKTYQELVLDRLIEGGYAQCDKILYDVKTNNRTAIYKI